MNEHEHPNSGPEHGAREETEQEHRLAQTAWDDFHGHVPEMSRLFPEHFLGYAESLHALGQTIAGAEGQALDAAISPRMRPYVRIDWMALAANETADGRILLLDTPDVGFYVFLGPNAEPTTGDGSS